MALQALRDTNSASTSPVLLPTCQYTFRVRTQANITAKFAQYWNAQAPPIGNNDLWIAARAIGVTLISNNTNEFERVSGLRLGNRV